MNTEVNSKFIFNTIDQFQVGYCQGRIDCDLIELIFTYFGNESNSRIVSYV